MENYRKELLNSAYEARQREFIEYQVNVTNYEMALDMAKEDADLDLFCSHLEELIRTTKIEQKKSKIMLDVLAVQIEGGT